MSSLDTYGIDGEEEINVNTLNSHFIDDEMNRASPPPAKAMLLTTASPSRGFLADGDVAVDHTSALPEIYRFDYPSPNYSQSPFNPIHMDNGNGNKNSYGGFGENDIGIDINDDVFSSNGPMLPPPTEMELEEGFALCEWRR